MAELDTTTKDLIEKHIDKIDRNDFIMLFDEIISEHDVKECEKVFNAMERADIEEANIEEAKKTYYNSHRIKQIKCYNVGFGDCFLCMDDNKNGPKMLVDCGEHRSFNNLAVLNDVYNELITAKQKNLMISHLHQDHYNGISKLLVVHKDLKFDNVYLPNYLSNGSLELYATMLFYGKKDHVLSKAARAVLSMPGIFACNLSHYAKIYFVCEGKIIYNNLCVFETMLPRKWAKKPCLINDKIIEDFCSKYLRIFNLEGNDDECATIEVSVSQEHNIKEQLDELFREYEHIELPSITEVEVKALEIGRAHV